MGLNLRSSHHFKHRRWKQGLRRYSTGWRIKCKRYRPNRVRGSSHWN